MIDLSLVLFCVLAGLIGMMIGTVFSLLPGLHIYSILGFVVLFLLSAGNVEPLVFSGFTISMLVGYCLGSSISAVFFQTPDDSSVFMVFPSQKYLADGRGYEAAYLSGFGAVVGGIIICVIALFAGSFLGSLVDLLAPHSVWIIITAMLFVWMSEWPKDPARQESRGGKLAAAWVQLLMGLFTILASGVLGIYLFFSQLVPPERSFQTIGAAFVGLFAVPSLIQNLFSAKRAPPQHYGKSIEGNFAELAQGVGAGIIGGSMGMFVPSLTAGVGNAFSRHAVSLSGDRSFMFSQGLARAVYYLGGVLLLFIPGVTIRRGGASLFITLFYVPQTQGEFLVVAATLIISAAVGWFFFAALVKGIAKTIHRINTRYIALLGLVVMLGLTYWMLGPSGILILLVSTAVGAVPLVFNTRRIHCIGVITVPMVISMAGLAPMIMQFFGLG